MVRYRVGGLLLLLALTYLLGEAWAVAGWQGRSYSWGADAISALGAREATADGATSTRHTVMNATFVVSGARVVLAGLVLAPFVPRRGRWAVLGLVLAHGVGVLVVGLFPADGASLRIDMHGVGAALAIVGGALLLAALTVSFGHTPLLAGATAVFAVLAAAGCAMLLLGVGGFGLAERLAVDAVIGWQVLAGLLVLVTRPPAGEGSGSALDGQG